MRHHCGIPSEIETPRLRSSQHSHFSDFFSQETETAAIIARAYATDFIVCGYSVDSCIHR
jgi:hypothetical protein